MDSVLMNKDGSNKKAKMKKNSNFKSTLKAIKKDWQLYSLLVLPIAYYIIFRYVPMYGNIIAFRRFVPGGPVYGTEWVGLRYFDMFIHDPTFWHVFRNTIILSVEYLVISFPFPIIFALLLNEIKSTWFKRFTQTVSYLPYFISTVVVADMIMQILDPSSGVINMILKHYTGHTINFLAEPQWFRTIYIVSGIWQGMGWGAILYLAALTNINPELYEAAIID